MGLKKRVLLLILAGLLLVCTALAHERQSNTQSEVQQAAGELEHLEIDKQLAQIILARTPDSMRDSSQAAIAESLRRGDAAAAELSTLTIPDLREQLFWERVAFGVSGIFGLFILILYLRRARLDQRSTDEKAGDVEH